MGEDKVADGPKLPSFWVQFPEKLQKCMKQFKKPREDNDGKSSTILFGKDKESLNDWEVKLEKQLEAWRENPTWTDQPANIKVSVPKGSLCNLNVKVNVGLPPDGVYNIVTDPENKRVFKNIKEVTSRKVLVDEGSRQVVELEQAALWRFLWWSGTLAVHVLVDQDRKDYSMKFKQVKTGFMKRFEGCWRIEPLLIDEEMCKPLKPNSLDDYIALTEGKGRIGSTVCLDQLIQPSILPPPPISWYLRGITTKTTEMLINDLIEETARVRGVSKTENPKNKLIDDECRLSEMSDIKERWAFRRRNGKRNS